MRLKKVFSLFFLFFINGFICAFSESSIEVTKKPISGERIKETFLKLINKEALNQEDEEFLQACRNYSLGTVGGLTCFYLIPPIGFGVIGAVLVKSLFAVAGGYGLVELFNVCSTEEIREKLKEFFVLQKEKVD